MDRDGAILGSRKLLDRDKVAELPVHSETDLYNITTHYQKRECVRGGKCVTHGVVGKKLVDTSKTWDKKKIGIYGWKVRSKTTFAILRGLRCPMYVLMMIGAVERVLPSPTVCLEVRFRIRLE